MTDTAPYVPVPLQLGRPRWRFTLHGRQFAPNVTLDDTAIGELLGARSRRVELAVNKPAQLTWTVEGRLPVTRTIQEMTTEVWAWRYDEQTGTEVCVGRFVVVQSQDTISEQSDTTNFTARSYLSLLARRLLTTARRFDQVDQDTIVGELVEAAKTVRTSSGTVLTPGSYLPIDVVRCYPNGVITRPLSGRLRDREYLGNQIIGEAVSNLSEVIDGFEYDLLPAAAWGGTVDRLRIFYPYQGVLRDWPALTYGGSGPGAVRSLTRSFNSDRFANYVRVVGNHEGGEGETAQVYAEAWNPDANDVTVAPMGLWMTPDSAADVSIQSTLDAKAAGLLGTVSKITPTYSLQLRSGAYTWGNPNLGDEVPLLVRSGRLEVETYARVLGITYAIGDDGQEEVELTVGQPVITLADLFTRNDATLSALVRR